MNLTFILFTIKGLKVSTAQSKGTPKRFRRDSGDSHGARPVHKFITMIKWIRTSRLSIKDCLSLWGHSPFSSPPRSTCRTAAPPARAPLVKSNRWSYQTAAQINSQIELNQSMPRTNRSRHLAPLWVVRVLSVYSRCCLRVCSAMVGVPHRPLLPSLPTSPTHAGESCKQPTHQATKGFVWNSHHYFVTVSVGTPSCPYASAYRRAYRSSTCWLFKKSLPIPLCGFARGCGGVTCTLSRAR